MFLLPAGALGGREGVEMRQGSMSKSKNPANAAGRLGSGSPRPIFGVPSLSEELQLHQKAGSFPFFFKVFVP